VQRLPSTYTEQSQAIIDRKRINIVRGKLPHSCACVMRNMFEIQPPGGGGSAGDEQEEKKR
jgi:hypothetical protein